MVGKSIKFAVIASRLCERFNARRNFQFDAESDSNNKDPSSNLVNGEQIAKSLGMMLCSAPAKCTAAGVHVAGEGLKSVSNTAQLAGGSANGLLNVGVRGGSGLVS